MLWNTTVFKWQGILCLNRYVLPVESKILQPKTYLEGTFDHYPKLFFYPPNNLWGQSCSIGKDKYTYKHVQRDIGRSMAKLQNVPASYSEQMLPLIVASTPWDLRGPSSLNVQLMAFCCQMKPGFMWCHITNSQYLRVLLISGFLSFDGQPIIKNQHQIRNSKDIIAGLKYVSGWTASYQCLFQFYFWIFMHISQAYEIADLPKDISPGSSIHHKGLSFLLHAMLTIIRVISRVNKYFFEFVSYG